MTRIIAGSARGRRLKVPPGQTRPTADRVRESMFAALAHMLGGFDGARVLDLYAGSGALGLEAASRGAPTVVLVERDRSAASVARGNAAAVAVPGVRVVAAPVARFLAGPGRPFDLVLADPPYASPGAEVEAVLARLVGGGWVARGALIVVERPTRDGAFRWPDAVAALRESTYGDTTLWYGRVGTDGEDR